MYRHRVYAEEQREDQHQCDYRDQYHDDDSLSLHHLPPAAVSCANTLHMAPLRPLLPRPSAELDAGLQVPNWGPPIPPSSRELHRIDMEGALKTDDARYFHAQQAPQHEERQRRQRHYQPQSFQYTSSSRVPDSSPGAGRGVAPPKSHHDHDHHVQSSPSRRPQTLTGKQRHIYSRGSIGSPSSCSSFSGSPSSDDDEPVPLFPFAASRESTGNHRALAASSTIDYQTARPNYRPALPRDALDRLDEWAAASASASDSDRSNVKHQRQREPMCDNVKIRPAQVVSAKPMDEYHAQLAAAALLKSPNPANGDHPRNSSPESSSPPTNHRVLKKPTRNGPAHAPRPPVVMARQLNCEMKSSAPPRDEDRGATSKATRDSSAETLVEEPPHPSQPRRGAQEGKKESAGSANFVQSDQNQAAEKGRLMLPSGLLMGRGAPPSLALPDDVTGLTSALGSPIKARLGVHHATLQPSLGKSLPKDRKFKLAELKDFVCAIEEELATAKDRLEGVEHREMELRADLTRIKAETVRGRDPRRGVSNSAQSNEHAFADQFGAMSQHIAALSNDLRYYKAAVDDLNHFTAADQRRKQWETFPSPERHTSKSIRKEKKAYPLYSLDMNEEDIVEHGLFRKQVRRLEGEVRRLQLLVEGQRDDGEGAEGGSALPGSDGARNQALPLRNSMPPSGTARATASSPIKVDTQQRHLTFADDLSGQNREHGGRSGHRLSEQRPLDYGGQPTYSALPVDGARVPSTQRTTVDTEEDDGNDTARPASAQISTRSRPRAQPLHSDRYPSKTNDVKCRNQSADDVTLAQTRVDHTTRSVSEAQPSAAQVTVSAGDIPDLQHDSKDCTVCLSRTGKNTLRAGRRQRVMDSIRRYDGIASGSEEDLLLSLLSTSSAHNALNATQAFLLDKLIKQHVDEFIHARMLYSELADELKKLHPDDEAMSSEKRKILVEHVLESVEELESRCERIEGLKILRKKAGLSAKGGRSSPPTTDHVRTKAASSSNPLLVGKPKRVSRVDLPPQKTQKGTTLSRALANSLPFFDSGAGGI